MAEYDMSNRRPKVSHDSRRKSYSPLDHSKSRGLDTQQYERYQSSTFNRDPAQLSYSPPKMRNHQQNMPQTAYVDNILVVSCVSNGLTEKVLEIALSSLFHGQHSDFNTQRLTHGDLIRVAKELKGDDVVQEFDFSCLTLCQRNSGFRQETSELDNDRFAYVVTLALWKNQNPIEFRVDRRLPPQFFNDEAVESSQAHNKAGHATEIEDEAAPISNRPKTRTPSQHDEPATNDLVSFMSDRDETEVNQQPTNDFLNSLPDDHDEDTMRSASSQRSFANAHEASISQSGSEFESNGEDEDLDSDSGPELPGLGFKPDTENGRLSRGANASSPPLRADNSDPQPSSSTAVVGVQRHRAAASQAAESESDDDSVVITGSKAFVDLTEELEDDEERDSSGPADIQHTTLDLIANHPEELLGDANDSGHTYEKLVNDWIVNDEGTNMQHEHFSATELTEIFTYFGVNMETVWKYRFPLMNKVDENHEELYIKPHQLLGALFDLKAVFYNRALLNGSMQGLGKTIQTMILAVLLHRIAAMIKDVNGRPEKHSTKGKNCPSLEANRAWWPFTCCPCEEGCPEWIKRKNDPPRGLTIAAIFPSTIKDYLDTYIKFFQPKKDIGAKLFRYQIEPLVFYGSVQKGYTGHFAQSHADVVRRFQVAISEDPAEDLDWTRYFCITTHSCLSDRFYKDMGLNNENITTLCGLIVIDEFHRNKRSSNKLWMYVKRIRSDSKYLPAVAVLSGTPHLNGLEDLSAIIAEWNEIWDEIKADDTPGAEWSDSQKSAVEKISAICSGAQIVDIRTEVKEFTALLKKNKQRALSMDQVAEVRRHHQEWNTAIHQIYRRHTIKSKIFGRLICPLPPLLPADPEVKVPICPEAAPMIKAIERGIDNAVERFKNLSMSERRKPQVMMQFTSSIHAKRPMAVFPYLHSMSEKGLFSNGWSWPQIFHCVQAFDRGETSWLDKYLPDLEKTADRIRHFLKLYNNISSGDWLKEMRKAKEPNRKLKAVVATDSPIVGLLTAMSLRKTFKGKLNVAFHHSHLSQAQRLDLRSRFEETPAKDPFGNIKQGKTRGQGKDALHIVVVTSETFGTGITVLRANLIVMLEPPLDASRFQQISFRAYRIGQKYTCWRYKLGNEDEITWEERIASTARVREVLNNTLHEKADNENEAERPRK